MLPNVVGPHQKNIPLSPVSVMRHSQTAHGRPSIGLHIQKEEYPSRSACQRHRPNGVGHQDRLVRGVCVQALEECHIERHLHLNEPADPMCEELFDRKVRKLNHSTVLIIDDRNQT